MLRQSLDPPKIRAKGGVYIEVRSFYIPEERNGKEVNTRVRLS